ncbi:zinc ribbon domain-containing protein [Levilactobacillus tongjiangensis]|uniref:Zinc ribbon domain-containing protein n=1 Tax=Levilactobacillus tongjiangensis TaxID=2486023 RepID=A0ABW1SP46_9LACO|nr:zinc ribbon domain-containing protein [Levilactobacillus tongjiangensis]
MAEELKFCPHCGAAVTVTDDVCPQCQTDLRPYRQSSESQPASAKLNLNSLYANPYREGMKRLEKRDGTSAKKKRWHWPWSKE